MTMRWLPMLCLFLVVGPVLAVEQSTSTIEDGATLHRDWEREGMRRFVAEGTDAHRIWIVGEVHGTNEAPALRVPPHATLAWRS